LGGGLGGLLGGGLGGGLLGGGLGRGFLGGLRGGGVGGLVEGALNGFGGGEGRGGRSTVTWNLGAVGLVEEAWRSVERGRWGRVSREKGSLGGMAEVLDHGLVYIW